MDMEEKDEISRVLGGSLLVPSVQELAKNDCLTTVPPRYVRHYNHHDQPPLFSSITNHNNNDNSSLQLPLIHLNNLFSPQFKRSELQKLHHACQHWGFFQVLISLSIYLSN